MHFKNSVKGYFKDKKKSLFEPIKGSLGIGNSLKLEKGLFGKRQESVSD